MIQSCYCSEQLEALAAKGKFSDDIKADTNICFRMFAACALISGQM